MAARSAALDTVRRALLSRSAYLRNVRWQRGVTCEVCAGVIKDGWPTCFTCHERRSHPGVADRLGFVTYARNRHQSGHAMYGYKRSPASRDSVEMVQSLLTYAVAAHWPCISHGF